MSSDQVNDLLSKHKAALQAYREWDARVKDLLKGRRMNDLTEEDMETYRVISEKRDDAYNEMRYYERALLDNIPGASTGRFPAAKKQDDD
jgi:hypothetical protein